MSDARGKWNSDAHQRSETEIADLAPYVSQSAVDAVRDAFRAIVLENQEHSELLDKLLPQLKEEPSRRSESLDWLDVQLAGLSDDTIIELIGRLNRPGSQGWQLDRESGASGPKDDRPPVEPATAPRGRLRFAATAAAGLVCLLATSYGWATAYRDYRDESRQKQALERKLTNVELQYDLLMMYLDLALSGQLDDPEAGGKLREAIAAFKARVGQVEAELDGLPAADDGWPP